MAKFDFAFTSDVIFAIDSRFINGPPLDTDYSIGTILS